MADHIDHNRDVAGIDHLGTVCGMRGAERVSEDLHKERDPSIARLPASRSLVPWGPHPDGLGLFGAFAPGSLKFFFSRDPIDIPVFSPYHHFNLFQLRPKLGFTNSDPASRCQGKTIPTKVSRQMAKEEEVARLWTKEAVIDVENKILQQVMAARTTEASEASVAFARFLRMSGLDSENYPLFLKMLEIENHWVLDALVGDRDPFLLLSTIPPNEYLTSKCFQLLTRWRAGGIYPKTLAIVLGVLQNTYSSPRDGYKIYHLSVADVDNLGKHLEKEKGQNDARNRCILDILDRIGSLEGLRWDESMEQVARQALKVRSNFFDNTKALEDCIPQVLLVRGDYRTEEVAPRQLFAD